MLIRRSMVWPGLLCLAGLAGCHSVAEPVGKSPLRPPRMSPDSVALDIFFVRFPFGASEANRALWRDVDEMPIPAEVRERLASNGFRVGLVGGQMPVSLSKLLELKGKPAPRGRLLENRLTDFEHESQVVRRHMEVRSGARNDIVTSDVQEELSVLLCGPDGLEGETFRSAQPVLVVRTFPEPDGRVRVRLVPEIQYGESKLRWSATQGAIRMASGRAKRSFDEMAIEAVLSPGQILVATTLVDRPPLTLGRRFFTERTDGQLEQKLLILRLAQTQGDELFDPGDVLPLDAIPEQNAKSQ